ncbi:kynureninase [Sphingorhabdus sp. Alg239-R122]|uniref:kynureninase n=1 Tax=Sphingorhabdus sp. Alg239-R122 TaxID=2305989 RepID=UPI0013D948EF|nr:kynureninase [Sphingorhabdus sp. Alg239-R122]
MSGLEEARARDAADPLGQWRKHFELPKDVTYLDGNSLGPLPRKAKSVMQDAVERQWGHDLIRSWNSNDWIGAPQRIGGKIAGLIGAAAGEVIVADSVSVNIFKLITAIVRQRGGTTHIISETGNFPTDAHVAAGAADILGLELKLLPRDEIVSAIADDTAMLLLTHVHYKTGTRFDMAAVTAAAKAKGVPVIWDLSHSTGAVPLDLPRDGAQYAVGCGYKYLNGGPGAPAFIYVAKDHQEALRSPLQGWMGHKRPFAFEDAYEPASGLDRMLVGTPSILSMLAMEAGVDIMADADMQALWEKSQALFDYMAGLMAARCPQFQMVSPTDAAERGSHISFAHEHAWPINNALIAHGVIGDFRAPDILRLGLTPLYLGFEDIWRTVDILGGIMDSDEWQKPQYSEAAKVT